MWGSDWELSARLLDWPFDAVVVKSQRWNPIRYEIWILHPDDVPEFYGRFAKPTEFPHFPYGYDVLPD